MLLQPCHRHILQAIHSLEMEYLTARDSLVPAFALSISVGLDLATLMVVLRPLVQQQWLTLVADAHEHWMVGVTPQGEACLLAQQSQPPLSIVSSLEQRVLDGMCSFLYPHDLATSRHSFPDSRIAQQAQMTEDGVKPWLRDLRLAGYIALAIDDQDSYYAALMPIGRTILRQTPQA